MSDCNFSINFTVSPEDLIAIAEKEITEAGGKFNGDTSQGSFELPAGLGKVKGTYTIENSAINIIITKKPPLVGCKRIEKELRDRLGNL